MEATAWVDAALLGTSSEVDVSGLYPGSASEGAAGPSVEASYASESMNDETPSPYLSLTTASETEAWGSDDDESSVASSLALSNISGSSGQKGDTSAKIITIREELSAPKSNSGTPVTPDLEVVEDSYDVREEEYSLDNHSPSIGAAPSTTKALPGSKFGITQRLFGGGSSSGDSASGSNLARSPPRLNPLTENAIGDDDDQEDQLNGFPRFSFQVEKSIYRISHVKLAQERRPLLEQVVISNLMLYILSVHAGTAEVQLRATLCEHEPTRITSWTRHRVIVNVFPNPNSSDLDMVSSDGDFSSAIFKPDCYERSEERTES
ncbi:hypothetical protein DFJ73DRAFT_776063 [Zopfochytrium polystomum]|nr:hypothetical protein DFJ73DRAFT_776063 [Zopfochytrium polystomum]